jgi:glycosyltransferase involved in cell wall biosynthesis
MSSKKPTVTVYSPCHNYGHYLPQAVESILGQSYVDWELIIIADGPTDETISIANRFAAADPDRISIITHDTAKGLQACANVALRAARGRYIMRLDPDDYLDENALLVLTHYMDSHPDVALVYSNYIYVDEVGNHLGVESRKRVGSEVDLLDLPAHGACSLVRKRVLKTVGGYDESYDRQDGYDLWLKILNRYPIANVPTPLFYYRQHSNSLSSHEADLLSTRAEIKRAWVKRNSGSVKPTVVAVVGAKNTYKELPNVVLTEFADKVLLDYTLDSVVEVEDVDRVLVTTDDPQVVDYVQNSYPQVEARLRPDELSKSRVSENKVLSEVVDYLEEGGTYPDVIVSLSVHCPLRSGEHIGKALDTLLLYNVDSVVSVYEDYQLHYVHASQGMEPLNPAMHRQIRVEREALFTSNGAIRVVWRDSLEEGANVSGKVGHIVMPWWDSFEIKTPEDGWLVEEILKQRQGADSFVPQAWIMEGVST